MRKRTTRIAILLLLLAVGGGVAVDAWGVERRLRGLDSEHAELSNRLDRLRSAVTFIGAAQHTYIGSGQPDELSLERVSVLVQQISNDTAALRTRARSPNSPSHVQAFADGLAGLINADARARQHLAAGQSLAAADAVFRDARDGVAVMEAKLREIRYAEGAAAAAEAGALETREWWGLGAVGVLWALGLMAFARIPPAAVVTPASEETVLDLTAMTTPSEAPPAPSLDLAATAELCTALSRLTDAAALPELLGRAAATLDAQGLIVWMGAGEELFGAAAHGYPPELLAQLGPIARSADNATAGAWRTGALRIVPAAGGTHGAIAAPLFGTDGCIGVLAVEVRNGRETEGATQAVTSMIAAQLATVLSAWPPASSAAEAESERHAAAS